MHLQRICVLLLVLHYVTANPATNGLDSENAIEDNDIGDHMGILTKCSFDGGFTSLINCAASRALKLIHHLANSESLAVLPGVSLVSNKPVSQREAKELTDLPQDLSDRTDIIFDHLLQSAGRVFSGRSLKIDIPEIAPATIARSLDEARGKSKKGGGSSIMYLVGAKILLLKSLLMAVLKFMSIKALILAKLALVISLVLAAQTFFGKSNVVTPYFSGWGSGWNSGSGPAYGVPSTWTTNSIGGWNSGQYPYARSISVDSSDTQTEAQDLAYANQKP
ncbi:hypothetical protein PPYR_11351 [Photinus pyralis]|uniref:Uncharacterized protein n=1 Tax=Photinus pyralis TaxID=7054 RepID=A0A5N4AB19_PHOPY|nr:uncharacterized protein LOC116177491 [Photinus pyralis]KAB0794512.1 hypothetical protein PPYR_11351 [Photinus pyralis]